MLDLVAIISCSIGAIACCIGIGRIIYVERRAHDPNRYAKPLIVTFGVAAVFLIVGAIYAGVTP